AGLPEASSVLIMDLSSTLFCFVRVGGCQVYDLDEKRGLDFSTNATSLILGHCNPQVTAAVMAQATRGSAFANPTGPETELATLLTSTIPSVQRLRFTNSGTEGVMLAIRAAR